jgi:hypothetical protein
MLLSLKGEKVKVLTLQKAKQDGSVDPVDKLHLNRFTGKSLASRIVKLKWVSPLNPEWLRVFSSINGSVSKRRSTTISTSTKRRSEDMKNRCIGRNKRNICENKSVHIGDVPSSDTVGTRV